MQSSAFQLEPDEFDEFRAGSIGVKRYSSFAHKIGDTVGVVANRRRTLVARIVGIEGGRGLFQTFTLKRVH